jgi:predicted O-linked N-acetylglucosamine transferase (SPINDLY family)
VATISEALQVAFQHHQAGRLDLAEEIYRRVLAVEPNHADAWHLLGAAALQRGRPQIAEAHIQRAIGLKGTDAAFHNNLGEARRAQGKTREAVECFRRALELKPDYAAAYANMGLALQELGRTEEAADCYRRMMELSPDDARAHNLLGTLFKQTGNLEEAVGCYRRALVLNSSYTEAYSNLGNTLKDLDRLDEAVAAHRRAAALAPDNAAVQFNLANTLRAQHQTAEAIACYRRAVQLRPTALAFHNNLGAAFQDQEQLDEAIACYRRAIQSDPTQPLFHNNLGTALQNREQIDEALACYRRALELSPDYAEAQANLGTALQHRGQPLEALVCYRRAVELEPDLPRLHSKYLCALRYCPDVPRTTVDEVFAEFQRRHAAPLRAEWRAHENPKDPDKSLVVGFVSPRFAFGPVGTYLIQVMENLASSPCRTVCYSDVIRADELSARFEAAAGTWRNVSRVTDQELAERIRQDGIDILFDLAGHSPDSRLLTFARKPAPIQVTWLDSVGSTGLSAMDYLLADRYLVPAGAETQYVEQVLRLPDGHVCYDPPESAAPVGPLPAIERGCVTFGSFTQPLKVNPNVVHVWARILRRLPSSRLVLKYTGWGGPESSRFWRDVFQREGVPGEQIEFQGHSPRGAYFGAYSQLDITLDPFPHNGGVTTCDSLWMGVPVVTCPGESFASRQSLSHLSNVGFTETIARDLDEYVEIALRLASDLPRLAQIRSRLREQMAASPLCDGRRFTEHLVQLLRRVWREWCRKPA